MLSVEEVFKVDSFSGFCLLFIIVQWCDWLYYDKGNVLYLSSNIRCAAFGCASVSLCCSAV